MSLIAAGELLLPAVLAVFLQPARTQSPGWLMLAAWLPQAQSQPQATAPPAPQDKADVNSKIESNLNSIFSGDPSLQGADISASVDDVAITLTGAVQSEGQHQRALALASQYTRYRKIVDKLTTK
jgi:osmotically-inducible protein OsmY